MYNHIPVKIIRTLGLFIGWLVLLGGIIQLLVSGKIFAMYPQLDAFYGLVVGVLIIWLSIERIHPEGYKFFGIFLSFSIVLGFIFPLLGALGFLLTVFVLWFFRDPERNPPSHDCIVSPADGVVCKIDQASPPEECNLEDKNFLRICIFMNVFNVHSNKAPCEGRIIKKNYFPGKFLNASLSKASLENERCAIVIERDDKKVVTCVQIAGLVARRILCYKNTNDKITKGERYGFIRFGSRVDHYLPLEAKVNIELGQKVKNTETIIAFL